MMKTIKEQIENKVDKSGFTWSEKLLNKVHLKVLLHLARNLSEYDISFIEKLDGEEKGAQKVEEYIKEKGINLEEVVNKEVEFVKASSVKSE